MIEFRCTAPADIPIHPARELMLHFGEAGFANGLRKGQPKIPEVIKSMLDRGLETDSPAVCCAPPAAARNAFPRYSRPVRTGRIRSPCLRESGSFQIIESVLYEKWRVVEPI